MSVLPALKPLVDASFADKLAVTNVIIDKQLRESAGKCAVAWSGGKDSTLVLRLVLDRLPDVPVVFNDTGVEYPETIRFIQDCADRWHLKLHRTHGRKTFWQCVDEYGWPRQKRGVGGSNRCCYHLKEYPAIQAYRALGASVVFDGVTAVENLNRQFGALQYGTCHMTTHGHYTKVSPILYWLPDEVFTFHRENDIPLNPIYQKGADRCGCAVCTAFLDWEKQLSMCNPKLYRLVKARKDHQGVMALEVTA